MHKTNKFAYANFIQLSIDVVFLLLTYGISYIIASSFTALMPIFEYLWCLIIFIPIWISSMAFFGMYDRTTFYYLDRIVRSVILSSLFSGLGLGTMFFFVKEVNTSRLFIGIFFLLCVIFTFLERYLFRMIYIHDKSYEKTPHIILVCSEDTYHTFKTYVKKTYILYYIVGIVQIGNGNKITDELNLGNLENLDKIIQNHVVDEIVFAMPRDFHGGLEKHVQLCEKMGITVHILLNLYDLRLSRSYISMLGPLPMLTFHTVSLNPVQKAMKRMMDIIGSLLGIAITLIAAIFIIPAIKLDSPGPIFFKQKRVGRYGRIFYLYKFRTMCVDAEEKKKELVDKNEYNDQCMFKIKNDPRITKVGAFLRKSSLDELPQFFNVLSGNMSLVGTRPPTVEEVAHYGIEQRRRISIKPGITGMWQVNGRSSIVDFTEVVALDTMYIDEWSIWLDVNILFKTIGQVIKMKSAC